MVKKDTMASASRPHFESPQSLLRVPGRLLGRCYILQDHCSGQGWCTLVSRQLSRLHPTARPMVPVLGLALCGSLWTLPVRCLSDAYRIKSKLVSTLYKTQPDLHVPLFPAASPFFPQLFPTHPASASGPKHWLMLSLTCFLLAARTIPSPWSHSDHPSWCLPKLSTYICILRVSLLQQTASYAPPPPRCLYGK